MRQRVYPGLTKGITPDLSISTYTFRSVTPFTVGITVGKLFNGCRPRLWVDSWALLRLPRVNRLMKVRPGSLYWDSLNIAQLEKTQKIQKQIHTILDWFWMVLQFEEVRKLRGGATNDHCCSLQSSPNSSRLRSSLRRKRKESSA